MNKFELKANFKKVQALSSIFSCVIPPVYANIRLFLEKKQKGKF